MLAAIERVAGAESSALRWSRAANIHLTLHFLGSLDEGHEANVRSHLGDALTAAPFDVMLGQLGTFPPARPPRVFWVRSGAGT